MRSIKESFELYLKLSKKVHVEMMGTIAGIEDREPVAQAAGRGLEPLLTLLQLPVAFLEGCEQFMQAFLLLRPRSFRPFDEQF